MRTTITAMAVVTCETCGSDDVVRDAESSSGRNEIAIRCLACDHRFVRRPAVICPRCGSAQVTTSAVDGWAYDDLDEAREDLRNASWSHVDRRVHRCQKCYREWTTSEGSRPYVPNSVVAGEAQVVTRRLPDPDELRARLKLGREEFVQRLMTGLIVGEEVSGWNIERRPTPRGQHFLAALDRLSFGADHAAAEVFVDEYELRPKLAEQPAGWPDGICQPV